MKLSARKEQNGKHVTYTITISSEPFDVWDDVEGTAIEAIGAVVRYADPKKLHIITEPGGLQLS